MDQFGVTNPKLKAIARTPFKSTTNTVLVNESVVRDNTTQNFLGAKIKNIFGQGEISAYGLPGEIGVLIVQVPAGSIADNAGLKKDDVILKCGDHEINNVDNLFKVFSGFAKGTKVTLEIWRLQQNISVEVSIK